jgi:hypothetical protein
MGVWHKISEAIAILKPVPIIHDSVLFSSRKLIL